jgi:hypothetical protein
MIPGGKAADPDRDEVEWMIGKLCEDANSDRTPRHLVPRLKMVVSYLVALQVHRERYEESLRLRRNLD